ncbi:tyrosine-type recombinase/integrase [Chloroflexota bacterium]
MSIEQLSLFPDDESVGSIGPPVSKRSELSTDSSLSAAMEHFGKHMAQQEFAENTIKSFLGDLRIFQRYLKGDPPVAQISTGDLKGFLHWLQYERGKPCSPKSYARRLTTLKVFFSWLAGLGIISKDPAAELVHKPVKTPLPRVLSDGEVEEVLSTTSQMMAAAKPDPRPHLLVTLLLHTGIKKRECMDIRLSRLDTSNPTQAFVQIRYDNPRQQYKERRLRLPPDWAQTLARYLEVYEPQDSLFPCTARNLEYVLTNVAKATGLSDGLSFEMLRWTCAVRDHQARMDPDRLRRKLGLSQMSWRETKPKIIRLAEPPL